MNKSEDCWEGYNSISAHEKNNEKTTLDAHPGSLQTLDSCEWDREPFSQESQEDYMETNQSAITEGFEDS